MILLAAASTAAFVYFAIGMAVGIRPALRRRPTRPTIRSRMVGWLDRSDTRLSPERFVGVVAGTAGVGGLTIAVLTGIPALAAIAAVSGGMLPIIVVDRRHAAAVHARRSAWPDALRDITTRLRSGASVHAALVDLAQLGPVPLRPAFQRYEALAAALDHRAALETVRNELAEALSDRIVEVLLVAFDQGTSIVIDVLDDLAESAVDELRLLADIDTAQLESKLEARSAAALPFVVLALLCAGSVGYRSFYASAAGTVVILVGFAMSLVGVGLITRLGRAETEPQRLVVGGDV